MKAIQIPLVDYIFSINMSRLKIISQVYIKRYISWVLWFLLLLACLNIPVLHSSLLMLTITDDLLVLMDNTPSTLAMVCIHWGWWSSRCLERVKQI